VAGGDVSVHRGASLLARNRRKNMRPQQPVISTERGTLASLLQRFATEKSSPTFSEITSQV
jgi:hypothetical protein